MGNRVLVEMGRTRKPRTSGLTMVIDRGLGPGAVEDLLVIGGAYIDYAKIAWATTVIAGGLHDKLALYRGHDVKPLLGGTLFEYAVLWDRVDQLLDLVRELRCTIEISDGIVSMTRKDKLSHIERFSKETEVFSEVGGKLHAQQIDWQECIRDELSAGATRVVIEGREIGPVGRAIRADLVDIVLEAAPAEKVVFEALEQYQQTWLIKRLGLNVNLGNIKPEDVMLVESLRQGLKEQTLLYSWGSFNAPTTSGPKR